MNEGDSDSGPSLDERLSSLSVARPNCLYFAITLTATEDGKIIFATQTEWAGWANEGRREELRRARLVYPKFAELWTHFRQPYAIVNTADEISLFLLGGGNALVEEQLGKSIFSHPLGIERSVRDGETGFVSPDLLPKSALHRVPTPKVRMQVLKRDHHRCRICGRRPDDYLDLVLHVHHIRPWEKGGITDPKNLITLCHTCHGGLEPHDDFSLFDYLRPKSTDPTDDRLAEFQKGVANYRRVGFLSSLRDDGKRRSPRRTRRAEPQSI
jgi:HNH endonuclease